MVQEFVNSHDMHRVWLMQKDIIQSYQDDMIKYADAADKSRIRECFLSISKQLSKENKNLYILLSKKVLQLRNMRAACNGLKTQESFTDATT